ncbi:MAG: histidine kinase, partial [Propionibacterium sp.]|nr:histidine kinase [Propionibacterium sp.]
APTRRRLMGLAPDSNVISLLWAVPFMVFLGFPIATAIQLGVTSSTGAPILWITLAFAAVYVATWVLNPPAPQASSVSGQLVGCMGAMFVLQLLLIWATVRAGVGGNAYLLSYFAASWTLLAPRRLVLPGNAVIIGFGGASVLLTPSPLSDLFLSVLSPLVTGLVCFLARSSIDYDRRTSVEHRQALALSEERERTRMSADLHDILGHTLTGITVKADLTGRLLDAGRIEDARAQLDDLTDLARTALGDVRSVVSANRMLTPSAELDSARDLLTSAGVILEVDPRGEPAPGLPATLVAHTIREATTNALLHAEPSRVLVTLSAQGVEVRNDGYSARTSRTTAGSGTGLEGLRARLGPGDTLEWGPRGGEWVVTLELAR